MSRRKNIFLLYDEYEDWKKADREIRKLIDKFTDELDDLERKWRHVGAWDTASREAIDEYIKKKLML